MLFLSLPLIFAAENVSSHMNIDKIIQRYFPEGLSPNIEVFDDKNIYAVYADIVKMLMAYPDIETSILQSLSYCFYEVLDNVLTHSNKKCGTALSCYDEKKNTIRILVADDGIGICASLQENDLYKDISEVDALRLSIQDKVTDGKGMGFGLYTTARLVRNAGIQMIIHSGSSVLVYDGETVNVNETANWQGTIVFFELHSNREINPNDIVDNRTDCETEFNETFLGNSELDNLW